ncbi:capsid assembly scaffolding protein Gp46 family protein [Corynebacterium auriscanis]|nr:DUF4355 domain-containing protein [Corynebacterium auriscanis]WJY73229.1 hypothetical protein CAURIC_08080 [Corynebacterium auriscanis]
MKNTRPWLRFIEGPQGGAATASEPTAADESTQDTTENDSGEVDSGEVDYKAKYEAMKTHSRDWEAKAKANIAAAKKLKELEDAEKTELEKLGEKLAASEHTNSQLQARLDQLSIAAEHGISPTDAELFLHGDKDTMVKQAKALAERGKVKGLGVNPAQGRGVSSSPTRETIVERAKKL